MGIVRRSISWNCYLPFEQKATHCIALEVYLTAQASQLAGSLNTSKAYLGNVGDFGMNDKLSVLCEVVGGIAPDGGSRLDVIKRALWGFLRLG